MWDNVYIPERNHYNHFSTPVALRFWGPGLRSVKLGHFSGFRKNLLAYLLAEILFPWELILSKSNQGAPNSRTLAFDIPLWKPVLSTRPKVEERFTQDNLLSSSKISGAEKRPWLKETNCAIHWSNTSTGEIHVDFKSYTLTLPASRAEPSCDFLRMTLLESSKIFSEHALHVARVQFWTQA